MKILSGLREDPRFPSHSCLELTVPTIEETTDPTGSYPSESILTDLTFVDLRAFPQDAITLIERNSDLLESYGIYPEYSPYLGIRNNNSPLSLSPSLIHDPIVSYILALVSNQLLALEDTIEV